MASFIRCCRFALEASISVMYTEHVDDNVDATDLQSTDAGA